MPATATKRCPSWCSCSTCQTEDHERHRAWIESQSPERPEPEFLAVGSPASQLEITEDGRLIPDSRRKTHEPLYTTEDYAGWRANPPGETGVA
jgi:hypothetical protein